MVQTRAQRTHAASEKRGKARVGKEDHAAPAVAEVEPKPVRGLRQGQGPRYPMSPESPPSPQPRGRSARKVATVAEVDEDSEVEDSEVEEDHEVAESVTCPIDRHPFHDQTSFLAHVKKHHQVAEKRSGNQEYQCPFEHHAKTGRMVLGRMWAHVRGSHPTHYMALGGEDPKAPQPRVRGTHEEAKRPREVLEDDVLHEDGVVPGVASAAGGVDLPPDGVDEPLGGVVCPEHMELGPFPTRETMKAHILTDHPAGSRPTGGSLYRCPLVHHKSVKPMAASRLDSHLGDVKHNHQDPHVARYFSSAPASRIPGANQQGHAARVEADMTWYDNPNLETRAPLVVNRLSIWPSFPAEIFGQAPLPKGVSSRVHSRAGRIQVATIRSLIHQAKLTPDDFRSVDTIRKALRKPISQCYVSASSMATMATRLHQVKFLAYDLHRKKPDTYPVVVADWLHAVAREITKQAHYMTQSRVALCILDPWPYCKQLARYVMALRVYWDQHLFPRIVEGMTQWTHEERFQSWQPFCHKQLRPWLELTIRLTQTPLPLSAHVQHSVRLPHWQREGEEQAEPHVVVMYWDQQLKQLVRCWVPSWLSTQTDSKRKKPKPAEDQESDVEEEEAEEEWGEEDADDLVREEEESKDVARKVHIPHIQASKNYSDRVRSELPRIHVPMGPLLSLALLFYYHFQVGRENGVQNIWGAWPRPVPDMNGFIKDHLKLTPFSSHNFVYEARLWHIAEQALYHTPPHLGLIQVDAMLKYVELLDFGFKYNNKYYRTWEQWRRNGLAFQEFARAFHLHMPETPPAWDRRTVWQRYLQSPDHPTFTRVYQELQRAQLEVVDS